MWMLGTAHGMYDMRVVTVLQQKIEVNCSLNINRKENKLVD